MKTILAAIGTAFLCVCFGIGLNSMLSRLTSWDGSIALSSLAGIILFACIMTFVVEW